MLLPLETAEGAVPPWVFGVIALVVLLIALAIVRGVGKSRPHS